MHGTSAVRILHQHFHFFCFPKKIRFLKNRSTITIRLHVTAITASNIIKTRSPTRESIKLTKHRGGSRIGN